jgi:hypothetical protein
MHITDFFRGRIVEWWHRARESSSKVKFGNSNSNFLKFKIQTKIIFIFWLSEGNQIPSSRASVEVANHNRFISNNLRGKTPCRLKETNNQSLGCKRLPNAHKKPRTFEENAMKLGLLGPPSRAILNKGTLRVALNRPKYSTLEKSSVVFYGTREKGAFGLIEHCYQQKPSGNKCQFILYCVIINKLIHYPCRLHAPDVLLDFYE